MIRCFLKFQLFNFVFKKKQIVSRNMTNLTPAQLEEFESTYVDKDETNTLHLTEMIAAQVASSGIVYSEEDMDLIQVWRGYV